MSKSGIIRCLLSVVLIVYLVFAILIANNMAARDVCRGFDIVVRQNAASRNFVTADEVNRLLSEWKFDSIAVPVSMVPMHDIESRLNAVENIEEAQVERLADNRVRITVTPMIPVARVFDSYGHSYYINRDGKRLTANARYRIDVPVVTGSFDAAHQPQMLLPLLERIASDSAWNALVAQVTVEPHHHDVILHPMIRGHVINLGDTSAIESKLSRVLTMYHKVLPLKGWNFYDTISVKWGGQVVATRRLKKIPEPFIRFDQDGDEIDEESLDNMLVSAAPEPPSEVTPTAPKPAVSKPAPPKGAGTKNASPPKGKAKTKKS